MTVKLLRGFAWVWGTLLMLSILIGIVGLWWKSGFGEVRRVFSPWNLWNYGLIFVLALPAVGATMLADHLEKRHQVGPPKSTE